MVINNIETGVNYPSITEFFDIAAKNPTKENELLSAVKGLSSDNLEHLIAIAKSMKK